MVSITRPTLRQDGAEVVVEARVEVPWPDGPQTGVLWFRVPVQHAPDEQAAADACFSLGLALAMAADGQLHLEAPVSRRLLAASDELQDILACWYPTRLRPAVIMAAPRAAARVRPAGGTVSCFTGGVDSFHTALMRADRITSLLFVHGFDIPLADEVFFAETLQHLRAAAAELGKPLLTMSTNLKDFTHRRVYWGPVAHGVALACAGTLLHRRHGVLLVPGTRVYSALTPWGSHPLTDRLRSTDEVEIVHEGAKWTRVEKTLQIAASPAARQHLRVCYQKTGAYNCCECIKCLRTMTALRLGGVLEQFEVFPKPLDLERLRTMQLTREHLTLENLRLARQVGDTEVAAALEHAIAEFRRRKEAARAAAAVAPQPEAPTAGARTGPWLAPRLRSLAARLRGGR